MAGTFTQHTINTCTEVFQDLKGYKCLHGTGKAAAVDTVCAAASQIMLTQSQCHSHILMCLVAGGDYVLQVHIGGVTALLDQRQELVEVTFTQGSNLLGNTGIFLIEVDATHHSPVAANFAQGGDIGIELSFLDLVSTSLPK